MGGCKCTFFNCENSTATSPETHFFHFPVNDPARCIMWIKMSNNLPFTKLPINKLKNKVICDVHFKLKDFMNSKKERLIKTAFPTIYCTKRETLDLVENPPSWLQQNQAVEIPVTFLKVVQNVQNDKNDSLTIPYNPGPAITIDDHPPKRTLNLINNKQPAIKVWNKPSQITITPNTNSNAKRKISMTSDSSSENILLEVNADGSLIESKSPAATTVRKISLIKPTEKNNIVLNSSLTNNRKIRVIAHETTPVITTELPEEGPIGNIVFENPKIQPDLNAELLNRIASTVDDHKKNFEEIKELISSKLDSKFLVQEKEKEKPKIESLNMTKVQLFNGIKKYLNPSMVALLRIEIFGTQEREWKPDEKSLSMELFKLGSNVYNYFRDEMRFRLPPSQMVEKWIEEDDHMDDLDDAC